ncbi:MAG: zinc-binding dehydrogenase [Eubacterium sp.]|nr:zinc-binding dehydrogenase [Eubacterium sp.]
MNLKKEDTLLIRGGTCALGYAAIQIARALGCKVIATTHREGKLPLLDEADEAVLDTGRLAGRISGVTKVLELVGLKTLSDSLRCVEKGGIVCNTGILGGVYALNGFDPIKYIPNGVYLTGFHSNSPTQEIMDDIFSFIGENGLIPCVGAVYPFADIGEACAALDGGKINGKIVVEIGGGNRYEW